MIASGKKIAFLTLVSLGALTPSVLCSASMYVVKYLVCMLYTLCVTCKVPCVYSDIWYVHVCAMHWFQCFIMGLLEIGIRACCMACNMKHVLLLNCLLHFDSMYCTL